MSKTYTTEALDWLKSAPWRGNRKWFVLTRRDMELFDPVDGVVGALRTEEVSRHQSGSCPLGAAMVHIAATHSKHLSLIHI